MSVNDGLADEWARRAKARAMKNAEGIVAQNGRLSVREAFNGFYVYDSVTQECRGMGDGVDQYHTEEGEPLPVGSKGFYKALRHDVKHNKWQWMEAYFGVTR